MENSPSPEMIDQKEFLHFCHSLSTKEAAILIVMFEELKHADTKYQDDKMSKKEIKASFQTIKCELQELKREISRKKKRPDLMQKEAIQVLSMAFKFCRDVVFGDK